MEGDLEKSVAAKFAHLSDEALMDRMNRAPDLGYDDEEVELTRRLKLNGLTWRWATVEGQERVKVYADASGLSEAELIQIMTVPGSDERLLSAAENEYYKRRGQAIGREILRHLEGDKDV